MAMRIDSTTYYNSTLAGILDNQSAISRLSQQIASGNKLLAPKDDPLATGKILDLSNQVAVRTQFAANQDKAELSLNYENTVLQEVNKTLQDARALLVGVNASNDPAVRAVHAHQLQGLFNHLLDLANSQDPGGNYMFAGFATATQPFANAGGGVATTYAGTPSPGGTRSIEVGVNRSIQVNDNLDTVYQSGVAGADLLQGLGQAIVDLPGNITQPQLDGYAALIDKAMGKVNDAQYRIAGALTEVADVRGTNQSLLLQDSNALGDLQQVDQAAAIIELQTRQTTLQAAEQSFAKTAGLSLFNFLS